MKQKESDELAVAPEVVSPYLREEDAPEEEQLASHWSDLRWNDAAEFLAEAASAVPIAGPALKRGVEVSLGLGKYSPQERLQALQWKWLLEQIPRMQEKIDTLLEHLPASEQPSAADASAVFEATIQASSKTADAKKRQLLKNALINSFDLKQYRSGLVLRLLSILEGLEYGDIELLGKISRSKRIVKSEELPDSKLSQKHKIQVLRARFIFDVEHLSTTSLTIHHLIILEQNHLITINSYSDSSEEYLSDIMRKVNSWNRLLSQDISYISYGRYTQVPETTQLGDRLLRLLTKS